MIYLFKDYSESTSWIKINASSKKDAILFALGKLLDKEAIDVETICDNLDLELIDIEELKEYE